MENIYNNLLEKCNGKVKSACQSFTQADGKKKYTITTENNGDTTYTSQVSIAKLDGEALEYDPGFDFDRDIDYLLDEDGLLDNFFCNFENCVSFSKDGKVKMIDYFTEDFQTDKLITVKEKKGKPSIMGIIVDLKRDADFTDAYYNGVTCDMTKSKRYLDELANHGDDIDSREFIDLIDEEEVKDFIKAITSKVQSGAELIPQGLYVIIDNRMYYLTADEYNKIRYDGSLHERDSLLELEERFGIRQLGSNLLKNKKQVLSTISQIIKSKYLVDKKYIDLSKESSIGTNQETFLTNLLSNDTSTYEFLESELKPKENVK